MFLVCFFPAWLYRITLKSTAWFWWPLSFLGGEPVKAKNPEEFYRKVIKSLWARTSIALSLATVVAFLLSNFFFNGAIFRENPLLTVFGYFLVVDRNFYPWQLLTILVALLSIVIVFWIDDANGEYHLARKHADEKTITAVEKRFGRIERLIRLRFLFAIVVWLLVGSQAILYFNSQNCWFDVPASVTRWAAWAYGPKVPPRDCVANVRTRF
jgi:hypothetical protein